MTKKKDPADFAKNQPKPARLGPPTKTCGACGKVMVRESYTQHEWIRRTFCSKPCSYKWKGNKWNSPTRGTVFDRKGAIDP